MTNLQEYQAGTNPWKADTDGDGLPDGWEVPNELNALDASDADQDPDRDGLTNLQEFLATTAPRNPDTDQDGLPDGLEVLETKTNPLANDIQRIVTVAESPGAGTVSSLGTWATNRTTIYAEDGRGYLEYLLNAPEPDMYRLEIEGGPHQARLAHTEFPLLIYIDSEYLGRFVSTAENGASGVVHPFTPWLNAGEHRVRVYWDNAAKFHPPFELAAVRLQSLEGPDANQNGVKDWVENRLRTLCAIERQGASSGSEPPNSSTFFSPVSPFCLEGRGRFLSMMQISGGATAQHGAGDRWYANVPLSPSQPITVQVSFQNGGLKETNHVVWQPTDLLAANDLTVRKGDALLLTAGQTSSSRMTITIPGATNYTGAASQPIVHRFDQTGEFTVTGTLTDSSGAAQTGSITVKVVDASFAGPTAAWMNKSRLWDAPDLPPEAVIESDPRLELEEVATGGGLGRQFNVRIDAREPHYLVARLRAEGPVMANVKVAGFRLFASSETYVQTIETYDDGSELVEMGLVLSPLLPSVTVRLEIVVGGGVFDDGTVTKELSGDDFNPLGQAQVRFIRPATVKTSVCHTTKAYQDEVFLGIH